jgi:hypothetical protein
MISLRPRKPHVQVARIASGKIIYSLYDVAGSLKHDETGSKPEIL